MRSASWLGGVVLSAAVLALGACGGEESGGGGQQQGRGSSEAQAIKLSADPGGALKFDKAELTAPAGKVTIDFDNPAPIPHAVEVEGSGVDEKTETVTKGKGSVSAELEAGQYEFYCPVGQHSEKGMEGTLKVG